MILKFYKLPQCKPFERYFTAKPRHEKNNTKQNNTKHQQQQRKNTQRLGKSDQNFVTLGL